MSEILWKRHHLQLPYAEILLKEYGDDVDVFDIPVEDGMQQLCWAIKKIAAKLKASCTCNLLLQCGQRILYTKQ